MNEDSTRAKVVMSVQGPDSLVKARQRGKAFARDLGLSPRKATLIAAVISELARNIIQFAGRGEIRMHLDTHRMLYVIASDDGPGIAEIRKALEPGYSTIGSAGLGLSGVQRIADQFRISSRPGATTVTLALNCAQEIRVPQRRHAAQRANKPAIKIEAGPARNDCENAGRHGGERS